MWRIAAIEARRPKANAKSGGKNERRIQARQYEIPATLPSNSRAAGKKALLVVSTPLQKQGGEDGWKGLILSPCGHDANVAD